MAARKRKARKASPAKAAPASTARGKRSITGRLVHLVGALIASPVTLPLAGVRAGLHAYTQTRRAITATRRAVRRVGERHRRPVHTAADLRPTKWDAERQERDRLVRREVKRQLGTAGPNGAGGRGGQQRQAPTVNVIAVGDQALAGANAQQVAHLITRALAGKGGSAIEVDSVVRDLGQRGVNPAVTQAALRGAHQAGWVKKAGKGKVAASAKTVRAAGVPQGQPGQRPGGQQGQQRGQQYPGNGQNGRTA